MLYKSVKKEKRKFSGGVFGGKTWDIAATQRDFLSQDAKILSWSSFQGMWEHLSSLNQQKDLLLWVKFNHVITRDFA